MMSNLPPESIFHGFTLLDFKTIDIQQLLSSTTGNEVVLAILADFKGENPEAVIRLIISQLRRVSRSEKELLKYLNQLNILSRLRNLTEETLKILEKMPVTIKIEEDFLYNQGVEKGIEKGELQGKAEKTREAAINMLQMNCAVDFICEVLNVKESYVLEIKNELDL